MDTALAAMASREAASQAKVETAAMPQNHRRYPDTLPALKWQLHSRPSPSSYGCANFRSGTRGGRRRAV